MTVVFGLGVRLCVRMRTTLENGVLRNDQLSGSAVNKTVLWSYRCFKSGLNKERMRKWHFRYRTLLRLGVFRMAYEHLYESC